MRPSIATENILIQNNIQVSIPASPTLMTPFVLKEQKDWFEDEIKFIRRFIKPGMHVIDIGANYGLYTLTMAGIIGGTGKLWAFEPSESTCKYLTKSISENRFGNIKLIQSGLSDRIGQAKLFTSPNAELNSLSSTATMGDSHETISLLTLDHCTHKYRWESIDFIKLDAEGEEANILKKGKKTLNSLSPLIMFELKHGSEINLPLIRRFKNMGYNSYRLVPGLNTLIPFHIDEPRDDFLLNLFCCKENTARILSKRRLMARDWAPNDNSHSDAATRHIKTLAFANSIPGPAFDNNNANDNDYTDILIDYTSSLSETHSCPERVAYLLDALSKARKLLAHGEARVARLATFARIAFDAGERALGIDILSRVIIRHADNLDFDMEGLFLPTDERYDHIDPGSKLREWLFSSILEQMIKKHAYSCYFTGKRTLPLFERLKALGFSNEEMSARHQLVATCFPSGPSENSCTGNL